MSILGTRALTKLQSVALIAVIVVAAVGGGAAYVLWSANQPPPEDIRIGICADLDMPRGEAVWQGAILAAEQINAEGGVLGRNITIVAEDDDSNTPPRDVAVATNALTKLLTVDKADYIIASAGSTLIGMPYQDICSQHKKLLIIVTGSSDNYTQRVLNNYEKYKYCFRTRNNDTTIAEGTLGDILTVANYTGFTKIAILGLDYQSGRATAASLSESLPDYGLEIVYSNFFPSGSTDFTSYLAAIEASGAEILVPNISGQEGTPFVKEWCDRQSPTVVWGTLSVAVESDFWELTEGKCEYVSFAGLPVISGYPLTNKTLLTREAFIQRWGEVPVGDGIFAYDTLRFILPDAIKRAGTTEIEAVIKALEKTDVETSLARRFVFTSSHDVLVGSGSVNDPAEDYMVMMIFQWQNGTQVPMKPEAIMKEAGATYKYPPWQGPWSK